MRSIQLYVIRYIIKVVHAGEESFFGFICYYHVTCVSHVREIHTVHWSATTTAQERRLLDNSISICSCVSWIS